MTRFKKSINQWSARMGRSPLWRHTLLILMSFIGTSFAVIFSGCNEPAVRAINMTETFVQVQNKTKNEVLTYDDSGAVSDLYSVQGTPQEVSFTPDLLPIEEGFTQVPMFLTPRSKNFTQIPAPDSDTKVDILIVVDNSGSMANKQDLLQNNFDFFMERANAFDWKIGVITTSHNEFATGQFRDIIQKGDYSNSTAELNALRAAVVPGTGGSGNERPIAAINSIIAQNPQGFLRQGAALSVVIVTDEDECSTGYDSLAAASNPVRSTGAPLSNCTADWDTPASAVDVLQQRYGMELQNVKVNSIIWIPGTSNPRGGWGYEGRKHQELSQLTNGVVGDIFADDYSSILDTIGAQLYSPIVYFQLDETPTAGTVSVTIDGAPLSSQYYQLEGDRVHFHTYYTPPPSSQIAVNYSIGQAALDTVNLTSTPLAGSIHVFINNVETSAYTYNPSLNKITLTTTAPVGSAVRVSYMRNPSSPADFPLGNDWPAPESVSVWINDIALSNFDYSVTYGTVHLHAFPPASSTIRIRFTPISTVPTSFPLSHVSNNYDEMALNLINGVQYSPAMTFNQTTNTIYVDPVNITHGSQIIASYPIRTKQTKKFQIQALPRNYNLAVHVNGVQQNPSQYVINGTELEFFEMLPLTGSVTLSIEEIVDLSSRFHVTAEEARVITEIRINNAVISQSEWTYDQKTREVVFATPPPQGAVISVTYRGL